MYSFFLKVFLVPKSREIQHLFMIYIRAWYLESAQQPPPPMVLPALHDAPEAAEDFIPEDSQD